MVNLVRCDVTGLWVPPGSHKGRTHGECVHVQRLREATKEYEALGLQPIAGAQRCGCVTPEVLGCQCVGTSSDTVALSGTGAAGDPWTWEVIRDPDASNLLTSSVAGLMAEDFYTPGFGATIMNTVDVNESTTGTSFGDLATAGPAVTVTTGTKALVILSGELINAAASISRMGYAVSGATTTIAASPRCLQHEGNASMLASFVILQALVAGSNTFTAKYSTSSASNAATFDHRRIIVIPI